MIKCEWSWSSRKEWNLWLWMWTVNVLKGFCLHSIGYWIGFRFYIGLSGHSAVECITEHRTRTMVDCGWILKMWWGKRNCVEVMRCRTHRQWGCFNLPSNIHPEKNSLTPILSLSTIQKMLGMVSLSDQIGWIWRVEKRCENHFRSPQERAESSFVLVHFDHTDLCFLNDYSFLELRLLPKITNFFPSFLPFVILDGTPTFFFIIILFV